MQINRKCYSYSQNSLTKAWYNDIIGKDRGVWLLQSYDLLVNKISESMGYISGTLFLKAFEAHYKMTLIGYRRKIRQRRKAYGDSCEQK